MKNKTCIGVRILTAGQSVCGPAVVCRRRLSFHGMTSPGKGVFTDVSVPELLGVSFKGAVLIFISGKGASPGARILDAACRSGNAPAAIINLEAEPIMVQGCVLNDIPFALCGDPNIFEKVKTGNFVTLDAASQSLII